MNSKTRLAFLCSLLAGAFMSASPLLQAEVYDVTGVSTTAVLAAAELVEGGPGAIPSLPPVFTVVLVFVALSFGLFVWAGADLLSNRQMSAIEKQNAESMLIPSIGFAILYYAYKYSRNQNLRVAARAYLVCAGAFALFVIGQMIGC
jgi:hypothetical protein